MSLCHVLPRRLAQFLRTGSGWLASIGRGRTWARPGWRGPRWRRMLPAASGRAGLAGLAPERAAGGPFARRGWAGLWWSFRHWTSRTDPARRIDVRTR